MKPEEIPTEAQVRAGDEILNILVNVGVYQEMGGLGGSEPTDLTNYKNRDLVESYINNEINTNSAIWIAMNREK